MKTPASKIVVSLVLKSPLFTEWSEQYVRLQLPDIKPGLALELAIDGKPAAFQYTGAVSAAGAEVLVRLGFAQGESKTLEFSGGKPVFGVQCSVFGGPGSVPAAFGGKGVKLAGRELFTAEGTKFTRRGVRIR